MMRAVNVFGKVLLTVCNHKVGLGTSRRRLPVTTASR